MTARILKFVIVLAIVTVPMVIVWDVVFPGRIYDCTDRVGLDYLNPGGWVHEPVKEVDTVVTGRPMSEPDTIRAGWSITGLWAVWASMFAVSVILSWRLSAWNPGPAQPHPRLVISA